MVSMSGGPGGNSNPHAFRTWSTARRAAVAQPTHCDGAGSRPADSWWTRRRMVRAGADDGTRTRNLRFTKPLLYQLSYIGATGRAIPQMDLSAPGNDRAGRHHGSSVARAPVGVARAIARRRRRPDRRVGCGRRRRHPARWRSTAAVRDALGVAAALGFAAALAGVASAASARASSRPIGAWALAAAVAFGPASAFGLDGRLRRRRRRFGLCGRRLGRGLRRSAFGAGLGGRGRGLRLRAAPSASAGLGLRGRRSPASASARSASRPLASRFERRPSARRRVGGIGDDGPSSAASASGVPPPRRSRAGRSERRSGRPCRSGSRWASDLEEQDRAGDGRVQRSDRAAHRDADEQVAAASNRRTEALALAPDDERERAAQVGLARGERRVAVRAGDPDAAAVEVDERAGRDRRPGTSSRCSTAPAEALIADGVSGAWRLLGKSTPWTPAASALRRSDPTLCGSSSESRTRTNGGSPRSAARARMSSIVAKRRGSTTRATPWWPSKPARAVSEPPSTSTIGIRRLVACRTIFSSACRRWGTTSSRRAGRRATNASSTGRRPATSSSSAASASGGGRAGRAGGRVDDRAGPLSRPAAATGPERRSRAGPGRCAASDGRYGAADRRRRGRGPVRSNGRALAAIAGGRPADRPVAAPVGPRSRRTRRSAVVRRSDRRVARAGPDGRSASGRTDAGRAVGRPRTVATRPAGLGPLAGAVVAADRSRPADPRR